MLQRLIIKNIALIDYAEINFTEGLNVLSGETGAGKSVILESLNFVLGAKADKSLIRTGQSECFVSADFYIENSTEINNILASFDFEPSNEIIISRKFNMDGRSSIKLNGNPVTASMLKKVTSMLVDVHGQSEHFHLLSRSSQLELIDKFGSDRIALLKKDIKLLYNDLRKKLLEFNALGGTEGERQIRLDVLNYQINEIENVSLKENEEEELITLRTKLKNQEKIANALNLAKSAINEEGGLSDVLSNVMRQVGGIVGYDKDFQAFFDRLNSVYADIDDLYSSADSLLENIEFDSYSPEEIESRLSDIKSLKKKYGNTFEEINAFLDNAKIEKDRLENFNQSAIRLNVEIERLKIELYHKYSALSDYRLEYSEIFSKNVVSELYELGMSNAKFEVNLSEKPSLEDCKFDSPNGYDELEFLFSANSGEPVKPLSLIISGGEMSRFMLAIKAQTAKYNDISTFVFDEIDTGISGSIAKVVAKKFFTISKDVQIIAITHLPQISAMADNNLLIEKSDNGIQTLTSVYALSDENKVYEIMRLIGGDKDSEIARKHAEELIQSANEYKNKFN